MSPMETSLDPRSFEQDLADGSPLTLIGFSSIQPHRPVPYFTWHAAFSPIAANKLFVRDIHQRFSQRGLAGAGEDAGATGHFFRRYMARRPEQRAICFGGSSGGFAALLYGWFIGAAEVHAFTPLTRLPSRSIPQLVYLVPGRQWKLIQAILALHIDPRIDRSYYDLYPLLKENRCDTRYHIYYSTGHPRDAVHAQRLADVPGMELHPYDIPDHQLSTVLRDSGELSEIVAGAAGRVLNPVTG
jgi:hypothetical protein